MLAANSAVRTNGRATFRDGYPGHADDGCHRQGISGDLFEGLISGDGRNREQIDFGGTVGQNHRDGVVMTGVAIENDFLRHRLVLPG